MAHSGFARRSRVSRFPVATLYPKGRASCPTQRSAGSNPTGSIIPPAFHSRNLFFKDVQIRHYVVEPLTFPGTYRTNVKQTQDQYAAVGGNTNMFGNWSDVDRQTELSDDDGSLTGFINTISVNEDPFLRAPVQTAQCRSNVGVDANNACATQTPPNPPTARTSPYDHITTVLYPADQGGGPDSSWAIECSNENCTGVPIYRQYLTGVKGKDAAGSTREWATWMTNKCDDQYADLLHKVRAVLPYDPYDPMADPNRILPILDPTTAGFQNLAKTCPSAFVRMAGMALRQRSVLTVNNGRYYIDTTQSDAFQRNTPDLEPKRTRFVNVFEGGKSYYVFFVFAKGTTHQTYQIYVGPGFKPADIKGVRVDITSLNPGSFKPWAGYPWTAKMNEANPNVVDVDVDFAKVKQDKDTNLDPKKLEPALSFMDDSCQPHTYCTKVSEGGKTTCGCDTKKLDLLGLLNQNYVNVCKNVCSQWAVADIDCPKGGCLGFKFTLPAGFKAQDQLERPKPLQFVPVPDPDPKNPWSKIVLQPTKTVPDNKANIGGCYYDSR
jgi:cell migration-inducing and hyaluronan-binding protein